MVGELHKRGYERLRISPGMSPSGMHWRCSITPDTNISPRNGALIVAFSEKGAHYSSSQLNQYFQWTDAALSDVEDLADKFIERFPAICKAGKGEDRNYREWYSSLLRVTEHGAFPIAYADWPLEEGYLTLVRGGDTFWMRLPPPGKAHE